MNLIFITIMQQNVIGNKIRHTKILYESDSFEYGNTNNYYSLWHITDSGKFSQQKKSSFQKNCKS